MIRETLERVDGSAGFQPAPAGAHGLVTADHATATEAGVPPALPGWGRGDGRA